MREDTCALYCVKSHRGNCLPPAKTRPKLPAGLFVTSEVVQSWFPLTYLMYSHRNPILLPQCGGFLSHRPALGSISQQISNMLRGSAKQAIAITACPISLFFPFTSVKGQRLYLSQPNRPGYWKRYLRWHIVFKCGGVGRLPSGFWKVHVKWKHICFFLSKDSKVLKQL